MRSHEFLTETKHQQILVPKIQASLNKKILQIDHNIKELKIYLIKIDKSNPEYKSTQDYIDEETVKYTMLMKQFTDYLAQFDNFIPQINAECKKYLSVFKQIDECLYSARKNRGALYQDRSLIDRIPVDSDNYMSILFDRQLDKLGVKAQRKNSIFTSGDASQISAYLNFGQNTTRTRYIIIPKDSADFSWSKTHDDIILDDAKDVPANINKFQAKYQIDSTNFVSALKSGNEILIHGEYYGIHISVWPDIKIKLFGE